MRRAFLQENNTLLYNHLILTEKLYPHLWEIQETATARMEPVSYTHLPNPENLKLDEKETEDME